jgi:acyl-CoA synthetase (AMP-forming)/AMP-acid ligase II
LTSAATLPDALRATAERGAGEYVFHLEEGVVRLSCAELADRAERGARRLVALGVEPGDAVGVLGPNRPQWVVSAFATWIAGAVLVPLQIPVRIPDREAFAERLRNIVRAGGCRRVLADPAVVSLLPPEVAVSWEAEGGESAEDPAGPSPEDPAVIQFTSGSTAAPKGALIAHSAAMAQMELLRHAYRYPDGTPRVILNWAPFFHDLGLFGNLVQPAVIGATIHQLPTDRFAADPAGWLRLIGETQASITVAPSSAFGSAFRAVSRRRENIDLSSLDAALFAAESVDPAVARRMREIATGGQFGLRPEALGSTYGLAEAVMAAAYSRPGDGLRVDRVSLEALGAAGVATSVEDGPVREIVGCGMPMTELRVVASDVSLPERRIGEIQVRGASTMSGYVGEDSPHPFADGWLQTGDLGYLADGELYVTGRIKDMVIVMGENYYPEDFEWAAGRVDGVRPGRCVAFGRPEADGLVVLVEANDSGAPGQLERNVKNAVADAIGVEPSEVLVLSAGTVQKTTSGKLRRAAMRRAFADGTLTRLPSNCS